MKVSLTIPKPTVKQVAIKGKTLEDAFKDLQKKPYWGHYASGHKHSASPPKKPATEFSDVKLISKPEIILPKWSDYSKATKEEQESWDSMLAALTKHEENHHKIFEDAAKQFKKELEAGDDLSQKDLTAKWKDFDKQTQSAQDAYDSRTDHGKKEGVELTW